MNRSYTAPPESSDFTQEEWDGFHSVIQASLSWHYNATPKEIEAMKKRFVPNRMGMTCEGQKMDSYRIKPRLLGVSSKRAL